MMFRADAGIIRLREAFLTSLQIGAATAVLCLAAGVPAAYAPTHGDFPGRRLADRMVDLPVAFPAIVLGIALLVIVSALPFELGMAQLVLAHAILALPNSANHRFADSESDGRSASSEPYVCDSHMAMHYASNLDRTFRALADDAPFDDSCPGAWGRPKCGRTRPATSPYPGRGSRPAAAGSAGQAP